MLSKALVMGAYQRKCELIAEHRDVELTVLIPPSWRTGRHVIQLERAYTSGYTLRVLPIRFNGDFHMHYYPTLHHELGNSHPDVVHIDEEPYNLATYLALNAAHHLGARAIFFSWQNLLREYPPPFRWMERHVLQSADAAIAGNRESIDVLRAKGYQGAVEMIPQFGVDEGAFSRFTNASAGENTDWFTVGYVGRLVKEKGVDLLLQVLATLPDRVRLLIVGTGDESASLRQLAAGLKLQHRVQFMPVVPSANMPTIYNQLDALVLPSRTLTNWKEQFGRALIEAMACEVPVVGSSSGEIPNVIGDAGLLFDEGSQDGLQDCLRQLIERPELRTTLARRGRERVLANYTMKRVADATVAFYRGLFSTTR